MRRVGAVCIIAAAIAAIGSVDRALAAEVTDVADAADGEDPFDAVLSVRVDYGYRSALITRENAQTPDGEDRERTVFVRELRYQRHTARLLPRLEVGVFHDLSLFLEWPIVLYDRRSTAYAGGTGETNSTLAAHMKTMPTFADEWQEPATTFGVPGVDREQDFNAWKFDPTTGGYLKERSGIDYPVAGIRWSPVNNERDPTKPTITLQADYKMALFPLLVAQDKDDQDSQVSAFVADATHRFHFAVAYSKRFLLLDPYFVADYTFPFAASDAKLGLEPRHDAGFAFGMEVVPYENDDFDQRLAIIIEGNARYFSKGRDYSEVSDVLGELTYTDEYMRTGGRAGLYFRALPYVAARLEASAAYETPHLLTAETVGCDGGCPGPGLFNHLVYDSGVKDGEVDINLDAGERNPYYNPALDPAGRRLRVEESLVVGAAAYISVMF